MTDQPELDLWGKLTEPANCSTRPSGYPHVPGCPRCEGQPGENGWCWNHQNDVWRAKVARETVSPEQLEQDRGIIERFKHWILAAAAAGKPMPLQESEDMTPSERREFQRRLHTAMRETGCCIVAAAPAQPPPRKRRGR